MQADIVQNYMDIYRASLAHVQETIKPYWTPSNIFWSVFVFELVLFFWKQYLKYRQHRLCVRTEFVPNELVPLIDQKTFVKSRKYKIEKARFAFVKSFFHKVIDSALYLVKGEAFLWFWSGGVMKNSGWDHENEYLHSAFYFSSLSIIGVIVQLPWSMYDTFVIEERHGFNKQTLRFFLWDTLKQVFVSQMIMIPVAGGVMYIIKQGGDYLFFYLWVFTTVLIFVLMTIYPEYIAPLFDKFTPLPDGELRTKIEELAQSISFPLKKIFVVDGSKRSAHSNAYMYGFFNNKRIVLFDTLFPPKVEAKEIPEEETPESVAPPSDKSVEKGCTDEQIVAILCHEFGHWKYSHVVYSLIITEIHMLVSFLIFGMLHKDETIFKAYGFETEFPTLFGLVIIMQNIYSPVNTILGFLMTALTRRNEYQADDFAKKMHRASYLREALIKLNKDNLDFPLCDRWHSAWFRTHPSLPERIERLGKID